MSGRIETRADAFTALTTLVQGLGQGRRRWLLMLLGVVAVVAVVLAIGPVPAEGAHNEVACDAGDVPVGWACTELLNKGTGGTQVVGELFFKFDSSTGVVTMATNLFGDLGDTGLSGQKLCIDDDTKNWELKESCLGGTAKKKISSRNYNLATPNADGLPKYEYMLEGAALGSESTICFKDGADVLCSTSGATGPFAKYVVRVDGYEFLSFHFNKSLSIEAFFTTPPVTIDCGETLPLITDGEASFEVTRMENVGGSACFPKPFTATVSDEENLITFIPEGDQAAAYSATLTFGSEPGLTQGHPALFYDGDDDGTFVEMLGCDGDPFSGSTLSPAAFQTGHTACIVTETTTYVEVEGAALTTWDIVFLGDPKFSFG